MKIIEALKELKTIEKRILSQIEKIEEYASLHRMEESTFGSFDKQQSRFPSLSDLLGH